MGSVMWGWVALCGGGYHCVGVDSVVWGRAWVGGGMVV